jgi:hypothetical protein
MKTIQRQNRPTLRSLVKRTGSPYEVAHETGANHGFAGVADEPAQNHQRWNLTLPLGRQMRWKRRQKYNPPVAWLRQQKRCDQDRIWRPENRDGVRFKRE